MHRSKILFDDNDIQLTMQVESVTVTWLSLRIFVGWLVGCLGFNGPLRQYFSLYRTISQREGERGEKG